MLKAPIERPALLVSELGLLLLGLVLTILGFINLAAAFTADRMAFVGAFIFGLAGTWCLSAGFFAILGHPRSVVGRAMLVAFGWLGATYPLGGALTYLGSGAYMAALPVAVAGIALALSQIRKRAVRGAKVP